MLDFEQAFAKTIDHAIENKADIFLFAGDAYKTAYPTPTQQKLLLKQLFRLTEQGIPVVIAVGNHDHPLSFGRAHALDVFSNIKNDGFYVFGRPGMEVIQTKSGPVQVVGIPWPLRNNVLAKDAHIGKTATEVTEYLSSRVAAIISKYAEQLDPNLPSFLVGHLTVTTGVFSGSEKCAVFGTDPLFMPSQLAIPPFDYVALGHLHRFQDLNKNGTPVVYSGSPERVDFGERKEDKGFVSGSVSVQNGNKNTQYSFNKLSVRPMIQIDVYINNDRPQTEQVLAKVAEYDLTNAIIKIVYYLPENSVDTVDVAAVQRSCSNAHYITAIQPVHPIVTRAHRAEVSAAMAPKELIEKYCETQKIEKKDKERIMQKALELLEQHRQKSERGDEAFEE